MSVKDINKSIIITDCLDNQVLDVIPCDLYNKDTLLKLIEDVTYKYVCVAEHGVMIKVGFKT